jgi:hypothetical protein
MLKLPRHPDGVHLTRVPTKRVHREADGNVVIPLWLQREGTFDMDLVLRMSPAEAELLHAQLCHALDDVPVTTPAETTPVCRQKTLGGDRHDG